MNVAAIVLAAGAGTRLDGTRNKVYLPVVDRPLIVWSLEAFEEAPSVVDVVLVTRASEAAAAREVIDGHGLSKVGAIVEGGPTRHASEHAALEHTAGEIDDGRIDLVCIHDAARPFVAPDLLDRVLDAARAYGGGVPCVEVAACALLRVAAGTRVVESLDTKDLRRAQTPQAFRASPLLDAYRRAARADFTGADTAECVERFSNLSVRAVDGDPRNLKVTYSQDLALAEAEARRRR